MMNNKKYIANLKNLCANYGLANSEQSEGQRITKFSSNKGFSGNSSILPRSKFGGGGQESSPQSLTAATLDRWA